MGMHSIEWRVNLIEHAYLVSELENYVSIGTLIVTTWPTHMCHPKVHAEMQLQQ